MANANCRILWRKWALRKLIFLFIIATCEWRKKILFTIEITIFASSAAGASECARKFEESICSPLNSVDGRHWSGPHSIVLTWRQDANFAELVSPSVPRGALSEKIRKWDGKPDREQPTTCGLCGVGCQINILAKNDEVIGGLPADSNQGRGRQLCVKGRFCIPELVTNHERLRRPFRNADVGKLFIPVEEAVAIAAEKLSQCPPENFAMLVSADATNEDLYIAQKFTRTVMGSHAIDTSSRTFYGPGFEAYLKLFEMAVPLTEVQNASAVVCVGLDTQFGRSTVGVEVRRALKEGAKLVSINSRHHNLDVIADKWLKPKFGAEADLLNSLVDLTSSTQAKVELKKDGQDPEELRYRS